jgi:hypothetical protein
MRPKMPNLSELPILELPEPSPHSNSLLDAPMLRPSFDASVPEEIGEDDEFVGGTSMLEPMNGGRMASFAYAASAPATILWGPAAHRLGGSSMGGRTPSKTLLEAMSSSREAGA